MVMMFGHKKKRPMPTAAKALHNKLIFSTITAYSQLSGVIRAHCQIPDKEIIFQNKTHVPHSGSPA